MIRILALTLLLTLTACAQSPSQRWRTQLRIYTTAVETADTLGQAGFIDRDEAIRFEAARATARQLLNESAFHVLKQDDAETVDEYLDALATKIAALRLAVAEAEAN